MSSRSYTALFCILMTISGIGLSWLTFIKLKNYRQRTQIVEAKEAVVKRRASESNAVLAKVEARQSVDETVNATKVDLTSHINASLGSSFVPKNAKDNNLSELQEGVQVLAGVPFNIKGSIQLSGGDLRAYSKSRFPSEATNIRVGTTCKNIHILHGSYFVKQLGNAIAKLVLHYTDGTTHEISIIAGQHVLDWWAPNYQTGVRKDWQNVSAPGSELAWVGSNPYLKRKQPHLSLRLFKSTFANPQPGIEIATIDYLSKETAAAPFLLGLTVE